MTHARIHLLARRAADARQRAQDARRTGDHDGYRYARAEAARLSRILAEG
jgi:hypothetical protein